MTNATKANQTWVCDAIQIAHTDVSENGVIYTVVFKDFLGIPKEIQVNREDCFSNFQAC